MSLVIIDNIVTAVIRAEVALGRDALARGNLPALQARLSWEEIEEMCDRRRSRDAEH